MKTARPLIGVNLLYVRPGYQGGTVRYAHELLKHLVRLDQYRWLLYVQEGAFPITDSILAQAPRCELRVVGGLAGRVLTEHLLLPLMARRDGVELLFSPGFVSPLWGRFRKIVTIPDLYYRLFPHFVRPWQRRYWQLFLPLSLRAADAAIAISDSTRADICTYFPWAASKVRRVHLGSDTLTPSVYERRDQQPFCLLVGNLTPNKNIGTVLAAFAKLKSRNLNCRLLIAGSDLFGELADVLRDMWPKPDVEILERVDDGVLAALYSQALCLIQASHYEGFGLPVIEAMAFGCPVIASDIPVMREVGGAAALYFPPNSDQSLADTVERIFLNAELRAHLSKLGRENINRFRWRDTAEQTAELFNLVINF